MAEKIVSVKDTRKEAGRRLPKTVSGFPDAGALDEITMRDNPGNTDRLRQRGLCDLRNVNLGTEPGDDPHPADRSPAGASHV
jgi:hypothetical protein